MASSEMARARMSFQSGSVMSTVVAPEPAIEPASRMRSVRPSITPKTSNPLRQVG